MSKATIEDLVNIAIAYGGLADTPAGRDAYRVRLRQEAGAQAAAARTGTVRPGAAPQRKVGWLRRAQALAAQAQPIRPMNAAEAQGLASGHPTGHPYTVPRSIGAGGLRRPLRRQQAPTAANAPAHPPLPPATSPTATSPTAYPAGWQPAPVTTDGVTFETKD